MLLMKQNLLSMLFYLNNNTNRVKKIIKNNKNKYTILNMNFNH